MFGECNRECNRASGGRSWVGLQSGSMHTRVHILAHTWGNFQQPVDLLACFLVSRRKPENPEEARANVRSFVIKQGTL